MLRGHCEAIGRPFDDIELCAGVGGLGRAGLPPLAPEVEGEPLRALGVTTYTINVTGPSYDMSFVRPWLTWRDQHNA